MSDAIQLLTEDHREVERLFEKYEQSGDPGVARTICEELTVHSMLEEELIYPLYRSKVETGKADEAREEHQEAKDIIVRIESLLPGVEAGNDDDELRSAVEQLKQSVQHHVEEEERDLFPTFAETLPDIVRQLGNDITERKQRLLANMEGEKELGFPPSAMGQKNTQAPT